MEARIASRRIGLIAGACLALAASVAAIPVTGTSSGHFVSSATGSSATGSTVMTGASTNGFTWGVGASFGSPSDLEFAGTSFAGTLGAAFTFGTLDFFNGTILAGTEATSVDLNVGFTLGDPAGLVQAFTLPLLLNNTRNIRGDAEASADSVRLASGIAPQLFFFDGVSYSFMFLGFSLAADGPAREFRALEQATASAQLVGVINAVSGVVDGVPEDVTAAPEPGTLALFGAGLLAVRFVRTRRRRLRG